MENLDDNIRLLCNKVYEVLNNNDWPTEEGHDREDKPSEIRLLVDVIMSDIK